MLIFETLIINIMIFAEVEYLYYDINIHFC